MNDKEMRHKGYKIFNRLNPQDKKYLEAYCNYQAQKFCEDVFKGASVMIKESIIKACRDNRISETRAEKIAEQAGSIFKGGD